MNRDQKLYAYAYWIAATIIALVLLSGLQKILYPGDFAVSVYRFHLMPGFLVNLTALYIPWLEIVCAVCILFVPRWRIPALCIVLWLVVAFTVAIGLNLWRGSVFGCGCFGRGSLDKPMSWLNIAHNICLMLLIGLAFVSRKRMTAKQPESTGGSG